MKTIAAAAPPARSAATWIQICESSTSFITPIPTATAGLNAPPEIAPTVAEDNPFEGPDVDWEEEQAARAEAQGRLLQ